MTTSSNLNSRNGRARPRTSPLQPLHAAQLSEALLRLSTVTAITGLGRSTIYAKLKAGDFVEPVRLGARCTRFRAGDVQAWLAAQGR
jgi:prophage regulatory protein